MEDLYSRNHMAKLQIANVMNELCKDKQFEKISVSEIVTTAGISRSSFYYHFSDKNEVVEWLSTRFYKRGLDQTGRRLNWFEAHLVTTHGFNQFAPLLTSAAKVRDYGGGQPFYIRHRQENLIETLTEWKKVKVTPKLRFQIEALPYAEKTMANNYEMGLYDFGIREYCEYIVSLVPRELYDLLNEPVTPQDIGSLYWEGL